jgi:hypothetical protein
MKMVFSNNISNTNNNISNTKFNKEKLFDDNLIFYVCSSGGCGSTLIFNYLKNFGKSYHIHDRYPPEKLCYIGSENTNSPVYSEWFNKTEIPEHELKKYKVLFVYRNPIQVIFSRFATINGPNIAHLQHIMCDNNGQVNFGNLINSGKDVYKLEEFFDNYTTPKKRNYDIICVKYEDFFYNISAFNRALGIPDIKNLYPIKQERPKKFIFVKELSLIYRPLMKKMNNMKFIETIKPLEETNQLEEKLISDDNRV